MRKGWKALYTCPLLLLTRTLVTPAMAINFGVGDKSLGEEISSDDFTGFFSSFKAFGTAISGICALTSLVFFVIALTKLSTSAGNDRARSSALKGVLLSGVALALFGGITVIVGVFWNAFG